jgi:hypothetical protein
VRTILFFTQRPRRFYAKVAEFLVLFLAILAFFLGALSENYFVFHAKAAKLYAKCAEFLVLFLAILAFLLGALGENYFVFHAKAAKVSRKVRGVFSFVFSDLGVFSWRSW